MHLKWSVLFTIWTIYDLLKYLKQTTAESHVNFGNFFHAEHVEKYAIIEDFVLFWHCKWYSELFYDHRFICLHFSFLLSAFWHSYRLPITFPICASMPSLGLLTPDTLNFSAVFTKISAFFRRNWTSRNAAEEKKSISLFIDEEILLRLKLVGKNIVSTCLQKYKRMEHKKNVFGSRRMKCIKGFALFQRKSVFGLESIATVKSENFLFVGSSVSSVRKRKMSEPYFFEKQFPSSYYLCFAPPIQRTPILLIF